MTQGPHPLQKALDKATVASYTAVDLLDIARMRKPNSNGREARPDARQASLYQAAIASSVGAIEETFEAFVAAGLAALGTPQAALTRLVAAIGKGMQSPNSSNLDNLLGDYLGFKPSTAWSAHLAYSPAVYRRSDVADKSLDHRLLYTNYGLFREFRETEVSAVLDRFVKIRNSFAHQDGSSGIFIKPEMGLLRTLSRRRAAGGTETAFVESVSATCGLTLNALAPQNDDPVVRWTPHETHAVNSLLMYVGLVASTCDALAVNLEASAGVKISDYDRLVLRIQDGRWWDWNRGYNFSSPNVEFKLTPYRPGSR